MNYATVHLLNRLEALKAANETAQKIKINLLGVSVLTSFNDEDLASLGFRYKVEDQVEKLVKIAVEANLFGVICSPLEIKMIKKTKIISTIGPSSNHPHIISRMIKKGMNVARLNMAHLYKEEDIKNYIIPVQYENTDSDD